MLFLCRRRDYRNQGFPRKSLPLPSRNISRPPDCHGVFFDRSENKGRQDKQSVLRVENIRELFWNIRGTIQYVETRHALSLRGGYHLSDIYAREEFRRFSYISAACTKTITEKGFDCYAEATRYLVNLLYYWNFPDEITRLKTAHNYFKANKKLVSASINIDNNNYLMHIADCQGIGSTPDLALCAYVALCSIELKADVSPGYHMVFFIKFF